ncbi:MAG: biotin/lipoate--protein ligase family protein, partial [Pseudomonadota bacterium]
MAPLFPPLITGHRLKTGQSPLRKAAAGARKGKFGAGDLLWVEANDTLEYAIILEPTVSRKKALDMVFTMMVALGDAIGALAPPEVAVTYTWPNRIRANGADIGRVEAILSDEDDADGAPRFLVVSPIIAVRPQSDDLDPGLDKDRTTLWDEGCGELTVVDLIDSSARHFMTWLNTWEEDGFTPVLS